MQLQTRQPSFVPVVLGFVIGLALITPVTFSWSFHHALVSSSGTTTEIEDINFTLGVFGTVLISLNQLIVLSLMHLLTKRRIAPFVYLLSTIIGPFAYHLCWLHVTPFVLPFFDITRPVYDFAPRTLDGINVSIYLAFLHQQEVVTWSLATLFALVMLTPLLWMMAHRQS